MNIRIFLIFLTLFSPSLAIVLDCKYYVESWGDPIGNRYTCKPTVVREAEVRNVTAITGVHSNGKSNSDVEAFYLYNLHNQKFIPTGLSKFFPNLILHGADNCPIEKISGDEIKDFTKLKYIFIANLLMETIPSDYFATNLKLERIYVFGNQNLNKIGDNSLRDLKTLNYADFFGNKCINHVATTKPQIPSLIQKLKDNCGYIEK